MMDPNEAKEALDLLATSKAAGKTSTLDFLKASKGVWEGKVPKIGAEDYEPPDGFEDCTLYHVDVLSWFGNQPYQFKIETLLSDAEAMAAGRTLNKVLFELGRGTASSFSISLRGKDGRNVSRAFTGVVYLEHDIPEFREVAEDESVDE